MKKLSKEKLLNVNAGNSTYDGVCAGAYVLSVAAAVNIWNPAGWVMAGVAAVSFHCFVSDFESRF
jgi:hypothetical protein